MFFMKLQKTILIYFCYFISAFSANCSESNKKFNAMNTNSYNKLTSKEEEIIIRKGTEKPFSGKYNNFFEQGTYVCKRCDSPLYKSDDKFKSGCGWPSFDDEISGSVKREKDADGIRTEILCANCGAHLGHVFEGEQLTDKNVRHCVNSISLEFVPNDKTEFLRKAYFAGGCFWGVEHLFQNKEGVISAVSGYMGGTKENPSYENVVNENTGHSEVVEVTYDTEKISYESLAKFFFEIHDPTQTDGQWPDIGEQYLSVIFFNDEEEKAISEKLIKTLEGKGLKVATKLKPAETFWKAEGYHQNYYKEKGTKPYCHFYQKKF